MEMNLPDGDAHACCLPGVFYRDGPGQRATAASNLETPFVSSASGARFRLHAADKPARSAHLGPRQVSTSVSNFTLCRFYSLVHSREYFV